jgi:hypothetical protein
LSDLEREKLELLMLGRMEIEREGQLHCPPERNGDKISYQATPSGKSSSSITLISFGFCTSVRPTSLKQSSQTDTVGCGGLNTFPQE